MKRKDLEQLILSFTQDVLFDYEGESACINPWNPHKIEVGYGDKVKTYDDIKMVMEDPFYHGRSLSDICEKLDIY